MSPGRIRKPFLIFNTVLHIVNGLLCFLLLARLLRWFLPDRRQAEWLAVAVALVWTASPFLASANLIVVQRMTGLSAFFTLLFLWFYLVAREGYRPAHIGSNLKLAIIAGAGTLLAGFAKENGFLLPVFLLLIERLLLPNARTSPAPLDRRFLMLILVAPTVAILAYLGYRGLIPSGYEQRDYSVMERLLTQPRVIFDYIRHLVLPMPTGMTPFHDNWQHSTGFLAPITTLFSIARSGCCWLPGPGFCASRGRWCPSVLLSSWLGIWWNQRPCRWNCTIRTAITFRRSGLYLAIGYPLFVLAVAMPHGAHVP